MTMRNGIAVWPPLPTEEQLTTPRRSKDGMHVEGWVRLPASGTWTPKDLLWVPPDAGKSANVDGIGQIVDVTDGIGDPDWVRGELDKRFRYLDYIRQRVREGTYRPTAALAKFLGLPFDNDSAQLMSRTATGTVAHKSGDAWHLGAPGRERPASRRSGHGLARGTGPIVTMPLFTAPVGAVSFQIATRSGGGLRCASYDEVTISVGNSHAPPVDGPPPQRILTCGEWDGLLEGTLPSGVEIVG